MSRIWGGPASAYDSASIFRTDTLPMVRRSDGKIDCFVFGLRFVCGVQVGLVISIRFVLFHPVLFYHESGPTLVVIAVGVILLCGFGAVWFGDEFWCSMFRR